MKKRLLLLTMLCCAMMSSFAVKFTVTAGGMVFTPSSGITMHVGDTIEWIWSDGVHTTTSTSVPPGATTWNSSLTSSVNSFIYKPAVAGTYAYQCNIHAGMGMTGSFTVIGSTSVTNVNTASPFSVFPNPATGTTRVRLNTNEPATILLVNADGREMVRKHVTGVTETELDIRNVPAGDYVIAVTQNRTTFKRQFAVTR